MDESHEGDPPEVSSWREIDWGWVIGWMVALVAVSLWLVQAEAGLAAIGLMASVLPIVVVVMSRGAQVVALVLFAVLTGAGGWWVYSASRAEGLVTGSGWDYAVIPLGLLVSAVAITGYAFHAGEWGRHSKAVGAERRSDGRDVGLALGAIVLALGMVLAVLALWGRLKARD